MTQKYKSIAVFGGASSTISSVYHEYMRRTGELLAEQGITMVFGIGDEGVMGSTFQGVRNKNGKVLGITTLKLLELQCKDPTVFNLDEIKVVPNLSRRKMDMFQISDALLIGPGGWGTMDEFSEFAVLTQTGDVPKKPMIFLNYNGFWRPMQELLLNMLQEGTINQSRVDYVDFVDTPEEIMPALERAQNRIDAHQK